MISLKTRYFAFFVLCLAVICIIIGCEFDEPYVPDFAGSSTLTGRIITDPAMDLTGMEALLHDRDSFADVTGADGKFCFQDIPPGDYLLHAQKKPYLQDSFRVTVRKSIDEDAGDLKSELKGAIAGTIPNDKLAVIYGEVELIVYVDGVPLIMQGSNENELTIDVSSTESNISIHTATRIMVYVDGVPYSALIQDNGEFVVEFVPPGIYNDIRVKLNSKEDTLSITSGDPVVVQSGQTRVLVAY